MCSSDLGAGVASDEVGVKGGATTNEEFLEDEARAALHQEWPAEGRGVTAEEVAQ